MPNYKISLAVKIPANYEIEVKAKNQKEAIRQAVDDFYYNLSGEFVEIDNTAGEVDFNIDNAENNGIYVEKL